MIEFDRVPPQAIEAEVSILGSMIIDNKCVPDVRAKLVCDDFYKTAHRHIYAAICQLDDEQKPVDLQTLTDQLRKVKVLDDIGGAYYLTQIIESVATSANIQSHIGIVKEKSNVRNFIVESSNIMKSAFEEALTSEEIAERFSKLSMIIHSNEEMVSIGESMYDVVDWIEERRENKGICGLSTGLYDLDSLLNGLQPGLLTMIAGRPSMGKSALSEGMSVHVAEQDKVVGFFSLENSVKQVTLRMMTKLARVNIQKIKDGSLPDSEYPKIAQAMSKLSNMKNNIFIDDTSGIGIHNIRTKGRRLKHRYGLDLIVIDYIQLMNAKAENRNLEISLISRGLKEIAKELDCHVIALSQLSRKCEERSNRRPQLSDARDGGSIEQDADIVLACYRPEYYGITEINGESTDGLAEIIVLKHRDGPTGTAHLSFIKHWAGFEDRAGNSYE